MAPSRLLGLVAGLVLTDAVRYNKVKGQTMRSDELEAQESEASCVDCPSYVQRSASSKKDVLWSRIQADEYKTPFETRCATQGSTCTCDGKVKYGHDSRWTSWKSVRDQIKCDTDTFGSNPANWEVKECYCSHEFPMAWIGLMRRNLHDQMGRVNNGTMQMFFDRFSDENPKNSAKVIHTFGSTALVRFVAASGTGYTGMFQKGAEHALLRLSIVSDWTTPCKGGTDLNFDGCLKPSLAFKMLRDGDYSSNTVAQVNLGQGVGWNFDFFKFTHATVLPTPTGLGAAVITSIFKHAAEEHEIDGVGLQELSSDGSNAHQSPSQIKDPSVAFFVPTSAVRGKFQNSLHDVRHDFKSVRSGTKLYDLYTVDFKDSRCTSDGSPRVWEELGGSCPKKFLGHVETTSRFIAGAYEDHRLFFQHERQKTKGGPWSRKKCASGGSLNSASELRMAGEPTATCSQSCVSGTVQAAGTCPFSELE